MSFLEGHSGEPFYDELSIRLMSVILLGFILVRGTAMNGSPLSVIMLSDNLPCSGKSQYTEWYYF